MVRLPFCTAAVCLPVLLRLCAGKGSDSPVTLGAVLLQQIRDAFPGRDVHGVGDAAYHGEALLVTGTTWTTRLRDTGTLDELLDQTRLADPSTHQQRPARTPRPPARTHPAQ